MAKQSQGMTMVERSDRPSSPAQILSSTRILCLLHWVMVLLSSHRPESNFSKNPFETKILSPFILVHQFYYKSFFPISKKKLDPAIGCDWWSISWSIYFIQPDINCEDRQSFWECAFFGNRCCMSVTLAYHSKPIVALICVISFFIKEGWRCPQGSGTICHKLLWTQLVPDKGMILTTKERIKNFIFH